MTEPTDVNVEQNHDGPRLQDLNGELLTHHDKAKCCEIALGWLGYVSMNPDLGEDELPLLRARQAINNIIRELGRLERQQK